MLPEKPLAWGTKKSCIRELMEFGAKRKQEIGAENVFDFSIGNPSIPAPSKVNQSIIELVTTSDSVQLHGYTSAAGLPSLRKKIAQDLMDRYNISFDPELMYITCGAAAGLASILHGIVNKDEEVIIIAPFFPEYKVFINGANGKDVVVKPDENLLLDVKAIKKAINEKTKAIIINSPNNPSGVIYPKENLQELAEVLKEAEKKYNNTIYLISDEPYRELVFNNEEITLPNSVYDDAIMCYSYSKSLSLPGERIGYIAVNPQCNESKNVFASIAGAARALGYVNAPSLMQKVIEKCYKECCDVSTYKQNRDLLCANLDEAGYSYVKPDGAFYLFVKALEDDAKAFSEKAKKHELLLVPSDDFGIDGYVRVAYCVSKETIINSLPAFKALMADYQK